MFENYFEWYYEVIFKENEKVKSKKVWASLINRTVTIGYVLFSLLTIFGVVCKNWYMTKRSFFIMLSFFGVYKLYQLYRQIGKEKKMVEIREEIEKYKKGNIIKLRASLKVNEYYNLNYVNWLIEACQLNLQKTSKIDQRKSVFQPVWNCIKFTGSLFAILLIGILLNVLGIPVEGDIYDKAVLLLTNIFGDTNAITGLTLLCILIIMLTIEYCLIFRDIIPELAERKREAQRILLSDLNYIKAELL